MTIIGLPIVSYQKITEDKASDANLPDAEIASSLRREPLRRGGRQTQTSRSNVRREGRQTQASRPLSDANLNQLRVSTQTQACAASRSNTDASL